MKNVLLITLSGLIGLLIATVAIKLTSVPEVYADSAEIQFSAEDGGEVPLWAIKEIKDKDGNLVPRENWTQILEGRYHLIPVSSEWQPNSEENH